MYYRSFKRVIDFNLSLVLIILTIPLFLLITCTIFLYTIESPFFFQKRIGFNNRIFKIYKFKTFYKEKKCVNNQVYNRQPTFLGHFLRRFKFDELPQLINVLLGDMSIIGPRPCLPELAKRFDENGSLRVLVRPGLAGLADINGGNYIPWEKRWEYDRIYVENLSLGNDLLIISRIIFIILFDENFYLNKNKLLKINEK